MWFRVKRLERLARQAGRDKSYRAVVWQRFGKNPLARWALRVLYVLIFIALTADFLANEKPLYCRVDGQTHFPVLRQYLVDLGLAEWEARFVNNDWKDLAYESVIWAPIPYSARTIDRRNMNFRDPFGEQNVPSLHFRHWLGTDQIGRDVAAGMIAGTRTAMLVGIIAMAIASLIGIVLGALAGFFGDDRLRLSRIVLFLNLLGLTAGLFYGFVVRGYNIAEGTFGLEILKSLGILALCLAVANLLAFPLRRLAWLGATVRLPIDLLVMRSIEIINSIPGLLLILSVVAVIEDSNILHVMVIIGLIGWTGIARFTRAEMLRIRNLEYIEAAQALGLKRRRIILRHALPNAVTPVLITIAFGVAGAILTEATLTFLSIGVAAEQVTWGSLLNLARSNASAWWLAIFPGFAIFISVTVFNLIGEGLTDALEARE